MEIREKYFEERFQGPSILFFKLRVTDAHPLRETHAIPLLGDQLGVDGLVGAAEQGCKRTVVAVIHYASGRPKNSYSGILLSRGI